MRYGATAGCVPNHLRMGGTVHRDSHDAVDVHIEGSHTTPFAGGKHRSFAHGAGLRSDPVPVEAGGLETAYSGRSRRSAAALRSSAVFKRSSSCSQSLGNRQASANSLIATC